MESLDELEERLGHRFGDRALLERALTHSSYINEASGGGRDNQRLEYLGDAVLDLLVAERLWAALPEAPEGALTQLRSRVVSEPTLARVAAALGLGDQLRLGRGEERSGGRSKPSLLGDALEAVIAAAYLDGGLEAARGVCERVLGDAIEDVIERGETGGDDYKSRLQEHLQSRGGGPPRYRVVGTEGPDHEKVFEVEVVAGDQPARGRGRSKREAEQEAARAVLERLGDERIAAGGGDS